MTLASRNGILKAGVALSAALLCLIIVLSRTILAPLDTLAAEAVTRPGVTGLPFVPPAAPIIPYAAALAAVLFAFSALLAIYYYFEMTQSPEILFFAYFSFSLVFETARLAIPLDESLGFPNVFSILCGRALIFGRYFGLFSLFGASIYAAGLRTKRNSTVILPVLFAALFFAQGAPLDTLSWDTTLAFLSEFGAAFHFMDAAIIVMTTVTFLIAAHQRLTPEYGKMAVGALLSVFGRALFFEADNWLFFVAGLAFLGFGAWLYCTETHKIYLWAS